MTAASATAKTVREQARSCRLRKWARTRTACASGRPKPPLRTTRTRKTTLGSLVTSARPTATFRRRWTPSGRVPPICTTDRYRLLRDMLQRPDKRPKVFYRGYNVFEPRDVGFVSQGPQAERAGYRYDTSVRGNSNEGHLYGTDLSRRRQRRAARVPENAIDRSPSKCLERARWPSITARRREQER